MQCMSVDYDRATRHRARQSVVISNNSGFVHFKELTMTFLWTLQRYVSNAQ